MIPAVALQLFPLVAGLIQSATQDRTDLDTDLIQHVVEQDNMRKIGTIEEKVLRSEFDCPCCGVNNLDEAFRLQLNFARHVSGIPFVITSGVRCLRHNRKKNFKDTSSHVFGFAGDIRVRNAWERSTILKSLIASGIHRIGIYDHHLHADCDPNKPKNVMWWGKSAS